MNSRSKASYFGDRGGVVCALVSDTSQARLFRWNGSLSIYP